VSSEKQRDKNTYNLFAEAGHVGQEGAMYRESTNVSTEKQRDKILTYCSAEAGHVLGSGKRG